MIRKRTNGDLEIDIPPRLGVESIKYYVCCYFRWKRFRKWREAVELAEEKISKEMDLLKFIRRTRMHGYALTLLADKATRNTAAMLAFSH